MNPNACYHSSILRTGINHHRRGVVHWASVFRAQIPTKADNPFDIRPQITCPSNVTVECAAPGGTPVIHPTLSGFNNTAACSSGYCDPLELTNNAPLFNYPLGITDVTFTATASLVGSCTPTSTAAFLDGTTTTAPPECTRTWFRNPVT